MNSQIIHRNWTEGGTGLTNFSPNDEPLYLAAIAAHGDPNYVISHYACDAPIHAYGSYSLHRLDIKDSSRSSSAFWEIFTSLRKEKS